MKYRPHGVGAMFSTALLDAADTPAGVALESSPTIAAGDFKRVTDLLPLGNLTAEYAAFTSGSEEPSAGDTVDNNGQTAVVIDTVVTSGTWPGGDAAGYIFLEQVSGTLASGAVDIDGGTSDVMTLSGDSTPSIGAVAIGTVIWFALTSAEMTCRQGQVQIADQDGPVWAATGVEFETTSDASSMWPEGLSSSEQADIRTAIGLASANVDTQLGTIAAYIDTEIASILTDTATTLDGKLDAITSLIGTPATDLAADIGALNNLDADGVWDEVIESSITARQLLRLFAAALVGKASGLGTTSAAFRDLDDSKNRIAATVDADGNRSAVTLDAS